MSSGVRPRVRAMAAAAGTGYQTMMNEALKQYLAKSDRPVTESRLREILREVFPASGVPDASRSVRTTRKK